MASDALATPDLAVGRRRLADVPVPVLLGVATAVVALTVSGRLLGQTGPSPGPTAMTATMAAAFTPLGVFVARRLPGHPLGRLMVGAGVAAALNALAVSWSALLPAAWLSQWTWWVPWALVPVLLLVFPDGRLPSPRWRPLATVLVGAATLGAMALAAAAAIRPRTLLTDLAAPLPPAAHALLLGAGVAGAVLLLANVGVLVALLVRWRRAAPLERCQLLCLLPAGALLAVGLTLAFTTEFPEPWLPAVVALPLGLTFAVLRYRFADLDLYVHRGWVWAVLTALAVAVYAVTVTVVSGTVVSGDSPWVSLLGAGAVAALLQPAERLAQRGVSRLLYGRRDEPFAVVAELGRHLGAVRDPLAVLPHIAGTIVEGLRVPYAAIRLTAADGTTSTVAEEGRWAGPPERFPLVAHGEPVGELLVAPRRAGGGFSGAEIGHLRGLAGQVAPAVEACRSAVALTQARDRLVLAREEERRRLRRDLHDGVASALVGTRMLAEVARRSVPVDGPVPPLLASLSAELESCSAEVRSLIDGLRPAALDHGLGPALTGLVDRFSGGAGPVVTLAVDGDLTELPAAVEVVAYRVVAEALTNVVKHARATTARVEARRDERHLDLRVVDDGVGLRAAASAAGTGVGLSSIRERVDELGGRCTISSGDAGGTRVELLLPVGG